ncbi:undecaprenyl-diphosphate phosphatase [Hydrogenophaga sp.]|uniref:undecaprenyl-diphosphate phosphatase n=1 Tax=Hydrogenophaga sp. TaxID=1904254 RepID=UPI003AF9A817
MSATAWAEAAFLGLVQGLTEFLPVSSSAHLRILRAWWLSLTQAEWRRDPDARMGWLILIGTLSIALLSLAFKDAIEGTLRNLTITAVMLIVFGVLLAIADRVGSKQRALKELSWGHGLLFGLAQAMALIPGVSRSGGTITAGLLMGYSREAAARYSFLLATGVPRAT